MTNVIDTVAVHNYRCGGVSAVFVMTSQTKADKMQRSFVTAGFTTKIL